MFAIQTLGIGAAGAGPGTGKVTAATSRAVVIWLCTCCALVFAMIVLGAAVRLTGSGLSMVDWRPLAGVLPPLDAADWARLFDAYKRHPEYRFVNPDMTIAGFRFIFWMEYAHRVLGRVIGVVFLLPFAFFWRRGMLSRPLVIRLGLLFFLGALQGVLGWWMVQSGLVDRPEVSHYRLLAHFMLAVIIYAGLVRTALFTPLDKGGTGGISTGMRRGPTSQTLALGLLLLMLASGALVAGSGAGYAYNSWPKMGADWLPDAVFALQPWWLNFVENPAAIQFVHRWLAAAVALVVGGYAAALLRAGSRLHGGMLLAALVGQIGLGIATLVMAVPPFLGVAHQAGAMVLLTGVVWKRRNGNKRRSP